MPEQFQLHINGETLVASAAPETPLLYVLRNDAKLNGPKFGCGLGQCGACTVLLGGLATRSCIMPISAVGGAKIVTLEGLGSIENPHALQRAFIDEQAAQCGYCTNGMIMTAKAFLDTNPSPTVQQIKQALSNNLCRCGSHLRIVKAVQRAADLGSSPQ
jgi:nicotinate dehydrogenase subunit A